MTYTTLFISLQENSPEAIKHDLRFCLDNGIDINMREGNVEGHTPLHYAVMNDSAEQVVLLLEYGADKNYTNKHNEKPVLYAKSEDVKKLVG